MLVPPKNGGAATPPPSFRLNKETVDANRPGFNEKNVECFHQITKPLSPSRKPSLLLATEAFIFHIGLMLDNKLITESILDPTPASVGLVVANTRRLLTRPLRVRLSQQGHDFAVMLNQQPILEKLKEQAKQAQWTF